MNTTTTRGDISERVSINKSTPIIVLSESVGNGKLQYRLLKHNMSLEESTFSTYGLEVECSLFGAKEKSRILDITPNYSYARELFDIISSNIVTPISLRDIVEDFLAEKYS